MPILWLLLVWLDSSTTASYEEIAKTDMKRNRAVKMQKHLLQGFRSQGTSLGRPEEGNSALTVSTEIGVEGPSLSNISYHGVYSSDWMTLSGCGLAHNRASFLVLVSWSPAFSLSFRTWACGCKTRTRLSCRECQVSGALHQSQMREHRSLTH